MVPAAMARAMARRLGKAALNDQRAVASSGEHCNIRQQAAKENGEMQSADATMQ